MELETRIQTLIAVGAAVSANCQPCLQSAVDMALRNGINEQEIAEAIEVGQRVRKGAASKMDRFVTMLHTVVPGPVSAVDRDCGCGLI
ncbi:MAG TPA: carboxymuconolactone decarboxylase family protein [Anaerolineales bacterium]|nr:carboxymuconolactone decarboxylase family protein [Anaerolineales bacterium]